MIHLISGTSPQTNPFERLQWMLVFGNVGVWKLEIKSNQELRYPLKPRLSVSVSVQQEQYRSEGNARTLAWSRRVIPKYKWQTYPLVLKHCSMGFRKIPFPFLNVHLSSFVWGFPTSHVRFTKAIFPIWLYTNYIPMHDIPKKIPKIPINLKGNTTNLTRLSKGWLWASSPLPCPGQATTCNIHTYLGPVRWCFMSGGCHYKPIFPSEFR